MYFIKLAFQINFLILLLRQQFMFLLLQGLLENANLIKSYER